MTILNGCQNRTSKHEIDSDLQGDKTRERINNNSIEAMNIFNNKWPVQFMIEANYFATTVQALNSISECRILTDFENHEISPADVHSWNAKMLLLDKTIKVSKMTYIEWEHPIYSFNWEESFEQVKLDSKIKKIEYAIKQNKIDYTLVDYLQDQD